MHNYAYVNTQEKYSEKKWFANLGRAQGVKQSHIRLFSVFFSTASAFGMSAKIILKNALRHNTKQIQ